MRLPDLRNLRVEFSSSLGIPERPRLDRDHQSNVPGLYIVGDLADAPIIKVALRQGYAVARHIAAELGAPSGDPDLLDVLVIGAGPAGIGAALAMEELGLSYVLIEREDAFSTIHNFPKGKRIFSEPRDLQTPGGFWFEDATKEELVERWRAALDDVHALRIQHPEEVLDAQREGEAFTVTTRVGPTGLATRHAPAADPRGGASNTYRARRVILAAGKRGQVQRLGVEGESLPHVHHALRDPADFEGKRVVVVGGGDSAVEAAVAIAEAGGAVTLSYRGDRFHRVLEENRAALQAQQDAGTLDLALQTRPIAIGPEAVTLADTGGQRRAVAADDVLVFIGNRLPRAFLQRLGVKLQGEMGALRALWIAAFGVLTYLFYVLKLKQGLFPFGDGDTLGFVPGLLEVDLGFRATDGGFWGTVLYSLVILAFGLRVRGKYPSAVQKRRYTSLILFQLVFLFGIPELLAPLVIERPWKLYALSVPWPLSLWSLVDAPSWTPDQRTTTALLWMGVGALTSFVAVPLYVRRNGERFCSYLCGCGGLAETLGDYWRHLAPRGRTAKQAEWAGRVILLLAVPVTLLILNDAWGFIARDALYSTKAFAQSWYTLMVDFWLAGVLGVAFYPYLGNRVWCRFLCPLRAWMEVLSRRFSQVTIRANSKCIGCSECTRYCQMGIDVQRFAQTQELLHNGNSSCIQCGICIEVCPMEVLSIDRNRPVELRLGEGLWAPPRATWEREA